MQRVTMSFFGRKKPRQDPALMIGGVEYRYCLDLEVWTFHYAGVEFNSYLPSLKPPGVDTLDEILSTIRTLQATMEGRINSGLALRGVKVESVGERRFAVDLDVFAENGDIEVAWTSYPSWGDLGVRFILRDGKVLDERWGD